MWTDQRAVCCLGRGAGKVSGYPLSQTISQYITKLTSCSETMPCAIEHQKDVKTSAKTIPCILMSTSSVLYRRLYCVECKLLNRDGISRGKVCRDGLNNEHQPTSSHNLLGCKHTCGSSPLTLELLEDSQTNRDLPIESRNKRAENGGWRWIGFGGDNTR